MINYFEHPKYITDEIKILKEAEAAYALREAWKRIYKEYPSDNSLAVLWSKSCLETGRWKHIHRYNFGNIKRKIDDKINLFTMFECGEEVSLVTAQKMITEDPERISIVRTYIENGIKKASIKIKPGHLWSQFTAHTTAEDGAEFYIRFVSQKARYAKAWQKVILGDPVGYAHELKVAGYYTADEKQYTNGVLRLFNEFLKRKTELMSWKPEEVILPLPITEPHDTSVDNIIPEPEETKSDILIEPIVAEHDTEVDNIIPKQNDRKTNLSTITFVMIAISGIVSWILQMCK